MTSNPNIITLPPFNKVTVNWKRGQRVLVNSHRHPIKLEILEDDYRVIEGYSLGLSVFNPAELEEKKQ